MRTNPFAELKSPNHYPNRSSLLNSPHFKQASVLRSALLPLQDFGNDRLHL